MVTPLGSFRLGTLLLPLCVKAWMAHVWVSVGRELRSVHEKEYWSWYVCSYSCVRETVNDTAHLMHSRPGLVYSLSGQLYTLDAH